MWLADHAVALSGPLDRLDALVGQPLQHPLAHPVLLEREPALALVRIAQQRVLEATEGAPAVDRDRQHFLHTRALDRLDERFHILVAVTRAGRRELDEAGAQVTLD